MRDHPVVDKPGLAEASPRLTCIQKSSSFSLYAAPKHMSHCLWVRCPGCRRLRSGTFRSLALPHTSQSLGWVARISRDMAPRSRRCQLSFGLGDRLAAAAEFDQLVADTAVQIASALKADLCVSSLR